MNQKFVVGCLVRWTVHGIYGVVEEVDFRKIKVSLDNGEVQIFTTDAGILERIELSIGSQVTSGNAEVTGVILADIPGQPQPTWQVAFPGRTTSLPERSLRPAVIRDPIERMRNGYLGRASDFNLKSVAADLWTQHLHNDLVSLDHARVDLMPHQVGVAHRVISNYPHRFLLCDEVGLGKTIEAAMIIKELKARKHARRVLILVPSGLQRQWQFELKTKFNESFAIYNRDTVNYLKNQGEDHPWTAHDQIISSHTWASWTDRRHDEITSVDWDLVIVDEAHHAREQRYGTRIQRTRLYRLVKDVVARPEQGRRAALFLTATPLQLQRHELYSLVDMLDPILFASEDDFVSHVQQLSGLSQLVDELRTNEIPTDVDQQMELAEKLADFTGDSIGETLAELNQGKVDDLAQRLEGEHRLSEVLIRNRRAVVGGFQPRSAYRWPVEPTDLETEIYRSLEEVLAAGFALAVETKSNSVGFLMTTFQRLATSSTRALLTSLSRRLEKLTKAAGAKSDLTLADAEEALDADYSARQVTDSIASNAALDVASMVDLIALLQRVEIDSKARTLEERLDELFQEDPEAKVLIFTQFRETQAMLKYLLERSGWGVHVFHGQLSPLEKDRSVEDFKKATGPQILVSTEAGGEGRNFQFCHLLVNYDLPWNPMKVEQRIGRVDRIGQDHPVVVFNLFVRGTIEERVLDVLDKRINLFTEAIGGLEPIIGEIESDIRKALRLAGEARDAQLSKIADQTETSVKKAREAERQMADLILDSKSFGAEIARTAAQKEEVVIQEEYETFLKGLLASANTYIDGPNSSGVYKVQFHAPLTVERPDLLDGRERRRVCFDPRQSVDSELVEYMGFGHPLVDALVESRIKRWAQGAASVRRIDNFDRSGWQFNWLVSVGSLRPHQLVHPTFVDDNGVVDTFLGMILLQKSRSMDREEATIELDAERLASAHKAALTDVGALVAQLDEEARSSGEQRSDEERSRVEALHDHRKQAATDRLDSTRNTLARLEESERPQDKAVVPLWRANVERADSELDQIDQDRNEMLADITRKMRPSIEFELLNVARIIGTAGADA